MSSSAIANAEPRRSSVGFVAFSFALALLVATAAFAGAPGPDPVESTTTDPVPPTDAARVADTPVTSHATHSVPRAPLPAPRPVLDPAARLLSEDEATESWTLFVELESGHRITQRFLLTNLGPGEHSAVALGHLVEPGRAPYRYKNGRRRARWKLSKDRLFFDIAASHLDLHRPKGELRITKDDIEIRLFFDFAKTAPSTALPDARLPKDMHVEVLAIGAKTRGTIRAPWMTEPLATTGRTWLVHTWGEREEADLLARRLEVFAHDGETSFYSIFLDGKGDWQSAWRVAAGPGNQVVESKINVPENWRDETPGSRVKASRDYPLPAELELSGEGLSGEISLDREWLRFDPLEVIPQPFRWFIRRASQPHEVWAEARIGGSLLLAPEAPPLPHSGEQQPASAGTNASSQTRGSRETERETETGDVTGVASITFLNPVKRR